MTRSTSATLRRKLSRLGNILGHGGETKKIVKFARQIRKSSLLDATWYLRRNPDVQKAGMDPVEHYLRFGAAEGRDPSPQFNTRAYLAAHPELAASGVNPLVHYLRSGAARSQGESDARGGTLAAPLLPAIDHRLQIANHFSRNAALPVFLSSQSQPRINLVLDTLDRNGLYGAIGTAIVLAALQAKRSGKRLRVISRDTPPAANNFRKVLSFQGVDTLDDAEFAFAGYQDDAAPVDITEHDLFITTSWWTTWATKRSVAARNIVYLLQDDERIFFPNGDERQRCAEILSDRDIRFVVNTQLLHEHLVAEGFANIATRGTWFEPSFSPGHYRWDDERDRGKMNFLFYARPGNLRNLYYRGLEVLGTAIETGIFDTADWSFHFAGKDLVPVALPRGIIPTLHQNLPWADYAELVRSIDLGLCLMQSPHPSYPPIDLAASGAVVLTSRFGRKTSLERYSGNIICADVTTEALLQGLRDAVARAKDIDARRVRFAQNGLGRDWKASFEPILARLAEAAP